MEVPELNLSECESVFVRDEFYESIQAPKFHDFCSSEEPGGDLDAYFYRLVGANKNTKQFEEPKFDSNVSKVSKDFVIPKAAEIQSCNVAPKAVTADAHSTVQKASVYGSKKVKPTVYSLTSLTKSQDKPPRSKPFLKASGLSNTLLSSPTVETKSNDLSYQSSSTKFHQSSENEDPNAAVHAKKKGAHSSGLKSDESLSPTAISSLSAVHGSRLSGIVPDDTSKCEIGANSTAAVRLLKDRAVSTCEGGGIAMPVDLSELRDRKRKPCGRNGDAGTPKLLESKVSLKSRVCKQQRKSSGSAEHDNCLEFTEPETTKSKIGSKLKSESSTVSRLSSIASSSQAKSRRRSDQSRRRKPASGGIPKPGRREVTTGAVPSWNGDLPPSSVHSQSCTEQTDPSSRAIREMQLPSLLSESSPSLDASVKTKQATDVSEEKLGAVSQDHGNLSRSKLIQGDEGTISTPVPKFQICHSEPQIPDQSLADNLLEKLQSLRLQQGGEDLAQPLQEKYTATGESLELANVGRDDTPRADDSVITPSINHVNEFDQRSRAEVSQAHSEEARPTIEGRGVAVQQLRYEPVSECSDESSNVEVSTEGPVPEVFGEKLTSEGLCTDLENRLPSLTSSESTRSKTSEPRMNEVDQDGLLEDLQNLKLQPACRSHLLDDCQEYSDLSGSDMGNRVASEVQMALDTEVSAGGDMILGERIAPNVNSDVPLLSEASSNNPSATDYESLGSGQLSESENQATTEDSAKPESQGVSPTRQEVHDDVRDFEKSKGTLAPHFTSNKKRKSIEPAAHRIESRRPTFNVNLNGDDNRKTKGSSTSSSNLLLPLCSSAVRVPTATSDSMCSSAMRVPIVTSVHHKKAKTTCPQPFRLRTEERGALKEVEFNKKVEQYLSAKDKIQSAPLAAGRVKNHRRMVKQPRITSREIKPIAHPMQNSQARAAERAQFNVQVNEKVMRADEEKQEKERRHQHDEEEEIKKLRKQMVPHAHKMPFFDRPFKPHRSTKSLTVPSSPKFHSLKGKKAYAPSSIQE